MTVAGFTDLAGKVAVVTGGAAGMGRGIAERMLAAGMRVAIADIEEEALRRASGELEVEAFQVDVRDYDQVARLADLVVERFGAVHVVCNNAGVGPVGAIEEMTLDDWRWVLDINLWGAIHGVKAFLPHLRNNTDGGWIVNTSSMSGLFAGPHFGAYTVSKYGVVALSETLAMELDGSGIGVSVLLPGPTETSIATGLRNRPPVSGSGLANLDLRDVDLFGGAIPWKTPQQVGDILLRGMAAGDLYIFTHPEQSEPIYDRFARIERASRDAAGA